MPFSLSVKVLKKHPITEHTCFLMTSVACMMHRGGKPWFRARRMACSSVTLSVQLQDRKENTGPHLAPYTPHYKVKSEVFIKYIKYFIKYSYADCSNSKNEGGNKKKIFFPLKCNGGGDLFFISLYQRSLSASHILIELIMLRCF